MTFDGANNSDADLVARADAMKALADDGAVGLVAKGLVDGEPRGWFYAGRGALQADRSGETVAWEDFLESAAAGAEITLTVVPKGSEVRIGVDHDRDGMFDQDEIDNCLSPSGLGYLAGPGCEGEFARGDCASDGTFDLVDAIRLLESLFLEGSSLLCRDACDSNDSGSLDIADPIYFLQYLFLDGTPPAAPHPLCAGDPTADDLGCSPLLGCD